jgi:6-phosphogluconolactonase
VHRVEVKDRTPEQAAIEYEEHLTSFFRLGAGELPRFDLILLGLGSDGHTASLFPDGPELTRKDRLVTWSRPPNANHPRITFTLPTINEAREIAFLVSGRSKAEVLRAVLEKEMRLPAAQIRPRAGKLRFFVDEAAAFGAQV